MEKVFGKKLTNSIINKIMKEKAKRMSYTAPKMEAASFNVEQGYASSLSASISMVPGGID